MLLVDPEPFCLISDGIGEGEDMVPVESIDLLSKELASVTILHPTPKP